MAGHTDGIVPIRIVHGLPFVSVEISANGRSVTLDNVVVDTGSASSIFSADKMLDLGLRPSIEDALLVIAGVGGSEYAFSKVIDGIHLGHLSASSFQIEVGAMDYGFEIDGILGMNFLRQVKARLDCDRLVLM